MRDKPARYPGRFKQSGQESGLSAISPIEPVSPTTRGARRPMTNSYYDSDPPLSTSVKERLLSISSESLRDEHRAGGSRSALRRLVVIVVLETSLLIGLLLWVFARGDGGENTPNMRCRPELYSPAHDAIEYKLKLFDVTFGGPERTPFQIPPSETLDRMWEDIYNFGITRIPESEARLLPNKTAPIPGDEDGYYIIELDVFHQLHCLNILRKALKPDHYPGMRPDTPIKMAHVDHCVDSIRQSLMCSGDTTALIWEWDEPRNQTIIRGNVAHTCIDFDRLRDWAKKNEFKGEMDLTVRPPDS